MKHLPHKGSAYRELVGGQTFIALDIETTSVRATDDTPSHLRLISIAVVCVQNGQRRNENHWLANPGVPVDTASSVYNGITTDDLSVGETPTRVLERLTTFLNRYPDASLVCHNAAFDIGVLREEYERIDQPMPERSVFDTMRIGARLNVSEIPRQPKLTMLADRYGITNTVTGTDARLQKALKDASDTADVFLWLLAEAADLEVGTWSEFVTIASPQAVREVHASYPNETHRNLVATIPGEHYARIHTHRLTYPATETEFDEWVEEAATCIQLRCAFLPEKVTLETEHAGDLLPLLKRLLEHCHEPGQVGTLLGGIQPMLAALDKTKARSWWKSNHATIRQAPRCKPKQACPSCVDGYPCPQDVIYQLITERAVEYGQASLISRQARNDLFKPGHYRKMDTWPRAGMSDMAAYMMWLVVHEYIRQGNTTRAREVLNQSISRDLHLVEPRLALDVAEYWAEQRRHSDVEALVTAVMQSATTDTAFLSLDRWLHDSFRPGIAAARRKGKKPRVDPADVQRAPSPVEIRPVDRENDYRYRVYS